MNDDLVSRLKANAICDIMIAPHELLSEAAQALTEARAEIERLRSTAVGDWASQRENDALTIQKYEWKERAEKAESELSTLRDMLVLCGELGGMGKDETPADYLRRLIDEVAGVESLRARVREVVGLGLDVISEERGWGTYLRMEGSEIYTDADVFSRAARQLMEEVK